MPTKFLFALFLATSSLVSQVDAQGVDTEKEADIRKLIRVLGAAEVGEQMLGQMVGQLRPIFARTVSNDERLNSIMQDMLARFQKAYTGEKMAEAVVPIYARHLTQEDIRGLLSFYESPLGKKLISVQPQILMESMEAGRLLGQQTFRKVLEEMAKDYPELKALLGEPQPNPPPTS